MIALLLPSYRRYADLCRVLAETPITGEAKFIVVANYDDHELQSLEQRFADRCVFVDERKHGKLGAAKAYELAYSTASALGFQYAVLFADDLIPADVDWLAQVNETFIKPGHVFGIFSSDECHHGHFGWNWVRAAPIAHFFIIKLGVLGDKLFHPQYRQYVIDLDITVRLLNTGHDLLLMPIKLLHSRSPLHREAMDINYQHDRQVFYSLHPAYKGSLERIKYMRYIPDEGLPLTINAGRNRPRTTLWPGQSTREMVRQEISCAYNFIKQGMLDHDPTRLIRHFSLLRRIGNSRPASSAVQNRER